MKLPLYLGIAMVATLAPHAAAQPDPGPALDDVKELVCDTLEPAPGEPEGALGCQVLPSPSAQPAHAPEPVASVEPVAGGVVEEAVAAVEEIQEDHADAPGILWRFLGFVVGVVEDVLAGVVAAVEATIGGIVDVVEGVASGLGAAGESVAAATDAVGDAARSALDSTGKAVGDAVDSLAALLTGGRGGEQPDDADRVRDERDRAQEAAGLDDLLEQLPEVGPLE